MNPDYLKQFEAYCPDDNCGDPVVGLHGEVYHTKRRMSYAGRSFLGSWVFRCPVCSYKRKFRESFWSNTICEE